MYPPPKWTAGPPDRSPERGLHETVADIARRQPERRALVDAARADSSVSYRSLDRIADAWAADLAANGVGPGDLVPIVDTRGMRSVVALLAVLKTGAAYSLLDPTWPSDRLAAIVVDQLDAPLVVNPHGLALPRPSWQPPDITATPAPPTAFRPVRVQPDAPCCVFFTSGTTGAPKGALTAHRAVARLFQDNSFVPFDENTVMPLAAPVPWDAFAMELWAPLLNGGTSLIVDEPYLSAAALRSAVDEHGANTAWLTSSVLNLIVDEDLDALRGLRHLLTGGERLSPPHVGRVLSAYPGLAVLNGYGPVENCVFATTHRITTADVELSAGIPLGTPVAGTGVHVLDAGRRCRLGEVGEICLTGTGLALGYLGADARPTGFGDTVIDGRRQRAYLTGDLGSWAEDGTLRYHGRSDRQIKVRGHRVEPAEVERLIERSDRVLAATVLPRHDDAGRVADLLAFCVPAAPGDVLDGLSDELTDSLVAYHRPAVVIGVERFPLTPQGKLDERALRSLVPTRAPGRQAAERTLVSALEPTPRLIVDVVAEVLDVAAQHVDPERSLFAQGLTSLGAGRVCARLSAARDRVVPIGGLYEDPTVDGLAAMLDSPDTATPDAPDASMTEVALTPMQLVFLTRDLVDPDDRTGHCLMSWVLDGDLDREALQHAVDEVHWRHDALSARYVADPAPTAWLDDVSPPAVTVLPAQRDLARAERALRSELGATLDLAKGEVWRVVLVPVAGAGDRTLLGCAVHHIAFDGFSEAVLAHDLSVVYNAARADDKGGLEGLPATAALGTGATAHSPSRVTDRVLDELRDVSDLAWPGVGHVDAPAQHLEFTVPPRDAADLDRLAKVQGHTTFTLLLTQWAAALADVTGQYDFAVGVPISLRGDPRLAHTIGCHLNTVPIRLRADATRGGADAVAEARARAFAGQEIPLPELLAAAGRTRTDRPPLFQVMFALQDNAPAGLDLTGVTARFVRQPYLQLPLELHTEIWPQTDGGLRCEIATRPDAVPAAAARELAAGFAARLRDQVGAVR